MASSATTRFPVSKRRREGRDAAADGFADQMMRDSSVVMRRVPFAEMEKETGRWGSGMGLFLLATQTTVAGMDLYQIPKKVLVEFPGRKNPNSKTWLSETRVWPVAMVWLWRSSDFPEVD